MIKIRPSKAFFTLVFCLLSSWLCSRSTAQLVAKAVLIRSQWSGLGNPSYRETTTKILSNSDGLYQQSDGTVVDRSLVTALVLALQAVPHRIVDLHDLGIDGRWLADNFAVAERRNDELQSNEHASETQRSLFRRTFQEPARLKPIVAALFSAGRHTDDNPRVKIEITFDDGSVQQAESNSQYDFMLPWRVGVVSGQSIEFNRGISRAVVALMPDGATNRERLNGDAFIEVLSSAVMEAIQDEWNLLEVQEKCPEVLIALRSRYRLKTATISGMYAIEYGREWTDGHSQETNVQAVVKASTFPPRFDETVVFKRARGQVFGVDHFLTHSEAYERLGLSVPWLAEYRKVKAGVSIHLYYVHSASLADRGLNVFRADMEVIGKDPLAKEVTANQNKVALLVVDENNGQTFTESHWIVLPDQRMILWRFRGPTSELAPFPGHECSRDDPEAVGGCVGRVKLPNGEWQRQD